MQPITSTLFTSIGKPVKGIFPVIDETDSVSLTISHPMPLFMGNRWNLIRIMDSGWIGSSCDLLWSWVEFGQMKKLEKA